jgi:hypothetical protein
MDSGRIDPGSAIDGSTLPPGLSKKVGENAGFDVSFASQNNNSVAIAQVSIALDTGLQLSITESVTFNGNQEVGAWSFTWMIVPTRGPANADPMGNGAFQTDVGRAMFQEMNNAPATRAVTPSVSSDVLSNTFNSGTSPTAGTTQQAQSNVAAQAVTGGQSVIQAQTPAATTIAAFQITPAFQVTPRPTTAQQVVLVPMVVMSEMPFVTVVDMVGLGEPPAPNLPVFFPTQAPHSTSIESGGGDNWALPVQPQVYQQMLFWLANGWMIQQPGPVVSITAKSDSALPPWGPGMEQHPAEGAVLGGEDRVTEKKAPDADADDDGPGSDGTLVESLAGAAVVAFVLGTNWRRYAEEEAEDDDSADRR